MKKQFVICDQDERYLARIQDYLEKKKLADFQIIVFHKLEAAIEESQRKAFELFLIGESSYDEQVQDIQAKQIFILKENKNQFSYPYPFLDKYQSMEQILQQILEAYTNDTGYKVAQKNGKKAKIMTFFSINQSHVQTKCAMAAGQILAKENRKVLYFNLQPYAGLEEILRIEETQDLTDFIYYTLQHSEKLGSKIDSMKKVIGGLSYMPSVADYNDLLSMTKQEWKDFVDALVYETGYEMIILDITGVSFGVQEILQNSDFIYCLEGNGKQEKASLRQFEKVLEKREWEDLRENMKKISFVYKAEDAVDSYECLNISRYGENMRNQLREDGVMYYG